MEALERDYTTAPITPQERVMVDYVVKLTKDATKVWKDDHEKLRAAGDSLATNGSWFPGRNGYGCMGHKNTP